MKGIVLAGGTGSRLDPLTRITNKHLLPVYDRPMVMYAIDALREAGITELMLVTGGKHVGDFRRLLGDELEYGNQERPGGIAEALGLAREFIGDARVVVMLADNIFGGPISETIQNFREQREGARVLLAHVRETEHLRIEPYRASEIPHRERHVVQAAQRDDAHRRRCLCSERCRVNSVRAADHLLSFEISQITP